MVILTLRIKLSEQELREMWHGKTIEKKYIPELTNDYFPILIEIEKKRPQEKFVEAKKRE